MLFIVKYSGVKHECLSAKAKLLPDNDDNTKHVPYPVVPRKFTEYVVSYPRSCTDLTYYRDRQTSLLPCPALKAVTYMTRNTLSLGIYDRRAHESVRISFLATVFFYHEARERSELFCPWFFNEIKAPS